MQTIKDLSPEKLWKYFDEITKVPRPSKKEEKIIEYILDFAKKNNLKNHKDKIGNIVITKESTKGQEKKPKIVLQSHLDMVCEKNSQTAHNFDTDAIETIVDGEWLKANETTLGADNGIGVATMLAILASDDIVHPALECLFTIDEETGLTGAKNLEKTSLSGKILINLDTEEEGDIYIGCAGGMDTIASFKYSQRAVEKGFSSYKVIVGGLTGGHSGDDIEKGRGNAVQILGRFLWNSMELYDIRLAEIDGGNKRNAIAREAYAKFMVAPKLVKKFQEYFMEFVTDVKNEYAIVEPKLFLTLEETNTPPFLIDKDTKEHLLNALYACPHGVIAMSQAIPGLVETSTNLASVKYDGEVIKVATSQRSSIESAKKNIAKVVANVFYMAGAKVEHSDGYPGWKPNPSSSFLKYAKETYTNLYGNEPHVKAIHAGLECGLLLEKFPDLDVISIGPSIRGAHSPEEKVHIPSVTKYWNYLLELLKGVPE